MIEPDSRADIRVYTFGHFSVERLIASPISGNNSPQYALIAKEEWRGRNVARSLFKFLLCRTLRRATKDIILDNLWPETDTIKASQSLDAAASVLRSVLYTGDNRSLLVTTHTGDATLLGLPGQQRLWLDADAFEVYLTDAAIAEQEGNDPLPLLKAAQRLAIGEFLEDELYTSWVQPRRHVINSSRHRLLYRLTDYYLKRDMYDQAEELLQTFLTENPTDEDALNRLMVLLAQQGRCQEALQLYKRTAMALQEEQLHPARFTKELAERIHVKSIAIEGEFIVFSGKRVAESVIPQEPFLTVDEQIPQDDAYQLAVALAYSNAMSWSAFNTSAVSGVLSLAQIQLRLLQRLHRHLPFRVRSPLYSGIYRLMGASLFFQERYVEALEAQERSYLAALEAADSWNMAESLSWQGGIWKACGRQDKAIEVTEAALRLIGDHEDTKTLASRARFLAHWAESAALLHQPDIVTEKLGASVELLKYLTANEEFDFSIWQQYHAICTLYLGDAVAADAYFQQALQNMRADWTQRRAYTMLLQAQARLKMREQEGSLFVARAALPLLAVIDSPLFTWGLIDYVQELRTQFPNSKGVTSFEEEIQHSIKLPINRAVSRYLEVRL